MKTKIKKPPKQMPPYERQPSIRLTDKTGKTIQLEFSSTIFNLRGDFYVGNLSNQLLWAGFKAGDDVKVVVERKL